MNGWCVFRIGIKRILTLHKIDLKVTFKAKKMCLNNTLAESSFSICPTQKQESFYDVVIGTKDKEYTASKPSFIYLEWTNELWVHLWSPEIEHNKWLIVHKTPLWKPLVPPFKTLICQWMIKNWRKQTRWVDKQEHFKLIIVSTEWCRVFAIDRNTPNGAQILF